MGAEGGSGGRPRCDAVNQLSGTKARAETRRGTRIETVRSVLGRTVGCTNNVRTD